MPYRIDVANAPSDAFDTLVDLGALDVDTMAGSLAAILPDTVSPAVVSGALGGADLRVSAAAGRDDGSVWVLTPRPVRIRSLVISPADRSAPDGALTLTDSGAFGTGLHATTALCLELLEDLFDGEVVERVLDVGTGSGILALASLRRGARSAVGLDIDHDALRSAAINARVNGMDPRLLLVCGSVDALRGTWPLVLANIRAAELMALASPIVRRIASRGRIILSGIPDSVAVEVEQAYRRSGMTRLGMKARDGWTALLLRASW